MSLVISSVNNFMTEQEYLLSERVSKVKREYIDGQVFAMAGAKINHNLLSTNITRHFTNHLDGKPCATFSNDMRLAVGQDYVYPDVMVDCSSLAGDEDCLRSPLLIVEVLSSSTRKIDTTTKLLKYINLPSLQEYVLVEQDIVAVQVLRRSLNWQPTYYYLGDAVIFESIALTLAVEDIYARVQNNEMLEFIQAKSKLSAIPEQN